MEFLEKPIARFPAQSDSASLVLLRSPSVTGMSISSAVESGKRKRRTRQTKILNILAQYGEFGLSGRPYSTNFDGETGVVGKYGYSLDINLVPVNEMNRH